ncbi:hypothetical protein [Flavobacterium sp. 3HN19-14]|uniref:hypothetical protein n=1 Tax=Flavobacterium sp. 3HN19-14 TaxID=3448133 RepID=UPI003EE37150
MKYAIFILLLAFSLNANAQKVKSDAVPSAIRNAFKKAFPTGKVAWKKKKMAIMKENSN